MNPIKGETPLRLSDGREYTLVLDFQGLIDAETAYRKPMAEMLADALGGFKGAQRAILFGALRTHHAGVSLRDTADMMMTDGATIDAALDAASEAAFPKGDKEAGNAPPPRRGKPSGRSGAKPGSTRKRTGGQPPRPSGSSSAQG